VTGKIGKIRNPILNSNGYVIDNCSSIMPNFSGITEKQPEV
jgi:hypothetical protein